MDTNMKRGLSRVCLLLAVLWVLGMGWYQYQGGNKDENSLTISLDKNTELKIDASGIQQNNKNEQQMQRLALIFLPALLLLCVVPVGGWISGGFKGEAK